MHIKRFRAATVAEALRDIKAELGPDALILSTKEVRAGFLQLGRAANSCVEVVAAVDRDARRPGRSPSADAAAQAKWGSLSLSKALLDPLEAELRGLRDSFEADRPGREIARMREELGALRDAVSELRRGLSGEGAADTATAAEQSLQHRGFGAALARELAEEIELDGRPLAATDRARLRATLARRLDTALVPPHPANDATIELFIGAPGVGKTTSLAKVAARDEDRCAMLSVDGQRAGAAETLRHFADESGVPFGGTTWSPDQLLTRATHLGRARLLVDTPGSSRTDKRGRAELARLRDRIGRDARVHWVASATTREDDLREELRRFDALRPDTLILTKADEATSLAHVANLILDPATPPLSWIGVGAHVPRDLVLPDPERLSRQMLGESL